MERARIDGLGQIGGRALAVDVPLSGDRIDYDAASSDDGARAPADDVSTSPLFPTSPRPEYPDAADPAPAYTPGAAVVDDDDDLF